MVVQSQQLLCGMVRVFWEWVVVTVTHTHLGEFKALEDGEDGSSVYLIPINCCVRLWGEDKTVKALPLQS